MGMIQHISLRYIRLNFIRGNNIKIINFREAIAQATHASKQIHDIPFRHFQSLKTFIINDR